MINSKETLDHLFSAIFVEKKQGLVKNFVRDGISQVTQGGDQLNVSLIPSSPLLRAFERELIYTLTKRGKSMEAVDIYIWEIFKLNFKLLKEEYDYIIFDCAPGISPITEVVIRSCDLVIVPTIPDFLSVYGLKVFCESIWQTHREGLPQPLKLPHVLVTKYQAAIRQHKDTCQDLILRSRQENPYFALLDTVINQSSYMASAMAESGIPTFSKKYSAAGAKLLDPLEQSPINLDHIRRL